MAERIPILVELDAEKKRALQIECINKNITMSECVRTLVDTFLAKDNDE